MKQVKFFMQSQIQAEADFDSLEDRINNYINNDLPQATTLGPNPPGYLDISFQFDPNNNSSYSDVVVMVLYEDDKESK